MSISVMLVEDKILIAEGIAAMLRKHGFDVLEICMTGEEALKFVSVKRPDLILMDIVLAGALDGISTAQLIREQHAVPIIYLSDFTDAQTVERAKKTFPANFLSKPFQEADLVRAIDIAFYNANTSTEKKMVSALQDHVFLRVGNMEYIKLRYDEIIYLKAARSSCEVVTSVRKHILSNDMSHIHEQLPGERFVRVHRSYVVNLSQITALTGNVIKIGAHEVQMSDDYRQDVTGKLTFLK